MVALVFGVGNDQVLTVTAFAAPNENAAVAMATAAFMRDNPAMQYPVIAVAVQALQPEFLRGCLRLTETQKPEGAQVVSLVPDPARGLGGAYGLHGPSGGLDVAPPYTPDGAA
jgi:hypothetical protein